MGITRSENMRRIRSRGTRPETLLGLALAAAQLEVDPQGQTPAGRPDFVVSSDRLAIFVDGCQWHGCPQHYVRPRTRVEFWSKKLRDAVGRDRRQTRQLVAAGWRVVRVWEHDILTAVHDVVAVVRRALAGEPVDHGWRVAEVLPDQGDQRLEHRRLERLDDGQASRSESIIRRTTKPRERST
jgi:DNA mismatch endonuclease (patch repair protein)